MMEFLVACMPYSGIIRNYPHTFLWGFRVEYNIQIQKAGRDVVFKCQRLLPATDLKR
jgi:hypothetical protein